MRKTIRAALAVLCLAVMLLAMASCGGKTVPVEADPALLQGVFDKLTGNTGYTAWKAGFNGTSFTETLDGDSIVISARGGEGIAGDYTFTLEDGYLVNTSEEGDLNAYTLMTYVKDAVADYHGMDPTVMSGYLSALSFQHKKNTLFTTDAADGKTVCRLYAAAPWTMEGLDKMYIDSAVLKDCGPIGEDPMELSLNYGKITAAVQGDVHQFYIIIGQYGRFNKELTYKSLMNIVKQLQPTGYKNFKKSYTELKEATIQDVAIHMEDIDVDQLEPGVHEVCPDEVNKQINYQYGIDYGIPDEVAVQTGCTPVEDYKYYTLTFTDSP